MHAMHAMRQYTEAQHSIIHIPIFQNRSISIILQVIIYEFPLHMAKSIPITSEYCVIIDADRDDIVNKHVKLEKNRWSLSVNVNFRIYFASTGAKYPQPKMRSRRISLDKMENIDNQN